VTLEQLTNLTRFELVSLGLGHVALDDVLHLKLNDAYRSFVAMTGELDDVVEVDVSPTEPTVEIPEYVRKIKKVMMGSQELTIANPSDVSGYSEDAAPAFFVTGEGATTGRVLGNPDATYEMLLFVRRSVKSVMNSARAAPSDMPEEFHTALVAKVVADMLRTQPGDMNRVAYIRDRDSLFFGSVDRAKALLERRRAKNVRRVAYGGI